MTQGIVAMIRSLTILTLFCLAAAAQQRITVAWPATGAATNLVMLDGVEVARTTGTNATFEVPLSQRFTVSIIARPASDSGNYTETFSVEAVPRWQHPQFRDGTNWVTVPLVAGQRVEATNNMQLFRSVMTRNREPVRWYRNWRGTNDVWGARYL